MLPGRKRTPETIPDHAATNDPSLAEESVANESQLAEYAPGDAAEEFVGVEMEFVPMKSPEEEVLEDFLEKIWWCCENNATINFGRHGGENTVVLSVRGKSQVHGNDIMEAVVQMRGQEE